MTLNAGAELCTALGNVSLADRCRQTADNMRQRVADAVGNKQAAALLVLAGMVDLKKAHDEILAVGGAKDFSTFYGYFMLRAMAKAGAYQQCLDIIKQFWGGMLDMGATTFWEDFNLDWLDNATPITELVPAGKKDIHGDCGAYCYKGLRHSLCHGWASGPTAWLTENVLGVKVLQPGCRKIHLKPNLGNLRWVEGAFPTPYGVVTIKHVKLPNGRVKTTCKSPREVKVVVGKATAS